LDLSAADFSSRLRKGFTPQQEQRLARVLNCTRAWLFDQNPEHTIMQEAQRGLESLAARVR
jgi:hypothetical protein